MKMFQDHHIELIRNSRFALAANRSQTILYHTYFQLCQLAQNELIDLYDLLNSKQFSAYVIQIEKGNLLPSDDKTWLEYLDLMRLYKAGVALIAYVSPQNIFNSFEIEKELHQGMIKIRIFKKPEDAVIWLEKELLIRKGE